MHRRSDKRTTTRLGQLPFTWVYEDPPVEPVASNPEVAARPEPENTKVVAPKPSSADKKRVRSDRSSPSKAKRSLRETVERYLREHSIPYVNVDEAKKALFAGAKLRSFHFVVYFKEGKNWLLYTSQLRKESREDLKQWEQIFGDGFVAVVGKQAADGMLKFRTLAGDAMELP